MLTGEIRNDALQKYCVHLCSKLSCVYSKIPQLFLLLYLNLVGSLFILLHIHVPFILTIRITI